MDWEGEKDEYREKVKASERTCGARQNVEA